MDIKVLLVNLVEIMDLTQNIRISNERNSLDDALIHSWVIKTYWAENRTIEETKTILDNSNCYGLYKNDTLVAFARVLSDKVVFAYLMDVLVAPDHQGNGYSKTLIEFILKDSEYESVQKWALATKDAHKLYEKFGFTKVSKPEIMMEKISVYWD